MQKFRCEKKFSEGKIFTICLWQDSPGRPLILKQELMYIAHRKRK